MPIPEDDELSAPARSLLTTLRSRGGSIRGDIAKDKVMWLFWSARPGETVDTAVIKELQKRRLIESHQNANGVTLYRLAEAGRK